MASDVLLSQAKTISNQATELLETSQSLESAIMSMGSETVGHNAVEPLYFGLTVLILACFVGYYVVWRVTPALHSPLMGVTNAISSVIIVGALIAAGPAEFGFSQVMGFIGVILASINIFGGFIVTQRMLAMFKRKGR